MFSKLSWQKWFIVGLSLCFLIASFTQPILYTAEDSPDSLYHVSIAVFFLGWLGFLAGAVECLFWFANPIYLLALFLFVRGKRSAVKLSVLASIIAISFSFMKTVTKNEAGGRIAISHFGKGYIFWVASIVILTIGIVIFNSSYSQKQLGNLSK